MIGDLIAWAYAHGYGLTFGYTFRDEETQRRMVLMGLSKTMNSKHCERLAVDFNLFIGGQFSTNKEDYRPLGEYWESLGGRWGGRFGVDPKDYTTKIGWDSNHFEYND